MVNPANLIPVELQKRMGLPVLRNCFLTADVSSPSARTTLSTMIQPALEAIENNNKSSSGYKKNLALLHFDLGIFVSELESGVKSENHLKDRLKDLQRKIDQLVGSQLNQNDRSDRSHSASAFSASSAYRDRLRDFSGNTGAAAAAAAPSAAGSRSSSSSSASAAASSSSSSTSASAAAPSIGAAAAAAAAAAAPKQGDSDFTKFQECLRNHRVGAAYNIARTLPKGKVQDEAYEQLVLIYIQKEEYISAEQIVEFISNPEIKKNLSEQISANHSPSLIGDWRRGAGIGSFIGSGLGNVGRDRTDELHRANQEADSKRRRSRVSLRELFNQSTSFEQSFSEPTSSAVEEFNRDIAKKIIDAGNDTRAKQKIIAEAGVALNIVNDSLMKVGERLNTLRRLHSSSAAEAEDKEHSDAEENEEVSSPPLSPLPALLRPSFDRPSAASASAPSSGSSANSTQSSSSLSFNSQSSSSSTSRLSSSSSSSLLSSASASSLAFTRTPVLTGSWSSFANGSSAASLRASSSSASPSASIGHSASSSSMLASSGSALSAAASTASQPAMSEPTRSASSSAHESSGAAAPSSSSSSWAKYAQDNPRTSDDGADEQKDERKGDEDERLDLTNGIAWTLFD